MHAEGKALMERGQLKAARRLANPEAAAERYVWLSFVDPDTGKSLGCTLVVADDLAEAIASAHMRGINPGGQVQGVVIKDDGTMNAEAVAFTLHTLRSQEEMRAKGFL